jgi:hypothetical protein
MRVIKLWAAAKKINNPSRGTLNSLGYLVMLLALAEQRDSAPSPALAPLFHASTQHAEEQEQEQERGAAAAKAAARSGSLVVGSEQEALRGSEQEALRAILLLDHFFRTYAQLGCKLAALVIFAPDSAVVTQGREVGLTSGLWAPAPPPPPHPEGWKEGARGVCLASRAALPLVACSELLIARNQRQCTTACTHKVALARMHKTHGCAHACLLIQCSCIALTPVLASCINTHASYPS